MENHQHEHVHEIKSLDSIFIISIVLNLLFVAIEALVGFTQNSLGLLSDAGHNLGDVFSLLLALVAFKLARVRSSEKYTYGYKKSTVLISLLNAIILLVAVGAIVVESIHKFTHPEAVNGAAVSWTAGAGIVVNGLTAWLLMKSQKKDLNVKGAFLHMAADTLVSVGVVISGLVMMFTGFYLIDPIISIVIAAVILVSTWKLLSQSVRLSLDGIPESVDMECGKTGHCLRQGCRGHAPCPCMGHQYYGDSPYRAYSLTSGNRHGSGKGAGEKPSFRIGHRACHSGSRVRRDSMP